MEEKKHTLDYLNSWTVENFARMKGTDMIEVLFNEKSKCLFFTYGPGKRDCGKVTKAKILKPIISEVKDLETGEEFYLLHNEGEGGATSVMTFDFRKKK
jgi:hypothetical protein